tara:strand:+ start:13006 stop:13905 length:900 start_codon:yes stop_codon:yes gene_type:complete
MRLFILLCIGLILFSCISLEPELEWEDVTSDHEPVLNIIALLSSDSLTKSFVKVHRSLTIDEQQDTLVRDTLESGEIIIYYASKFVVKDAVVKINDGVKEYEFEYLEDDMSEYDTVSTGFYYYDGDDLIPQPGELWTLSVTTPGGFNVTGETTIPSEPVIYKEELPETFQLDQTMNISWQPHPDNYQILNTGNLWYWNKTGCGLWQEEIVSPNEESFVFRREICGGDEEIQDSEGGELLLNLMSMDNNYFDYFIRYGEDPEFSSLFLGEGGSGRSFGIEGGIGIFGAVLFDRHVIPIVP